MAVTLYHVGRTPAQIQYGLDTFTEHYKAADAADLVLIDASVPQQGAAHPTYSYMFVTSRYATETGTSSCALDITYTGCIKSSGGVPVLPAGNTGHNNPVQSATTFAEDGTSVSVEFYAVETEYSWISYLTPGSVGSAPAPSGTPKIISYTVGNASFSPAQSLSYLFELAETDVVSSNEIVAGKYWQNSERRTRYYGAFLNICHAAATPGRVICLHTAGSGYAVGNTLTCTDLSANTAVLSVTAVGGGGAITDFSITSDSIPASIYLVISATGGSGSGASFRFYGA